MNITDERLKFDQTYIKTYGINVNIGIFSSDNHNILNCHKHTEMDMFL